MEDYHEQDADLFMEELDVYDNEMDITDLDGPPCSVLKSMPISSGKTWRRSFLRSSNILFKHVVVRRDIEED
jgi:hypothetical protein